MNHLIIYLNLATMDTFTALFFAAFVALVLYSIYGICKHLIDDKSISPSHIITSTFITGFVGVMTLLRIGVQLQVTEGKMEHANLWFFGTLALTFIALSCLIYGLIQFALNTIRDRK